MTRPVRIEFAGALYHIVIWGRVFPCESIAASPHRLIVALIGLDAERLTLRSHRDDGNDESGEAVKW